MPAEAADARPVGAFWRTLRRWDASKIIPAVAVRNTAGFTIAFVAAAALGGVNAGVLAALGALNVSYSDGLDPYALRARRISQSSISVCRTVSYEMSSTTSSSTSLSANRRRDQRFRPFGAGVRAKAIRCASCTIQLARMHLARGTRV